MDWNATWAFISVLVSTAAGVVGWRAGRRQEVGVNEWRQDVRAWASECIDALTEAAFSHLPTNTESQEATLRRCAVRLSALVDRGRLFFPNLRTDQYGSHKPPAFRGLRHAVLDALVAAHRIAIGETVVLVAASETIIELKRQFVSEIQAILAPELHNRQIRDVVYASHQTAKGQIPMLNNGPPRGAEHALAEAVKRVTEAQSKRAA